MEVAKKTELSLSGLVYRLHGSNAPSGMFDESDFKRSRLYIKNIN
jgi:hypothetical protein